jgi:hypothetical protein
MNQEATPQVYTAIAAVTKALSKEGIGKDRKNQTQGYAFRGIDDVYNALAPFLAEAGLCILPKITERTCTERETQKGGTLFNVVVRAEFDFVSAKDGTSHQVVTYGEAMDSADKATNKAMSAAYKYAAMQAFCIPTEGDNDADAHTHEVKPNNGSWATNQKPNGQYKTQASADTAERRIAEERAKAEAAKKAKAESLDKSLQVGVTDLLPPADPKPWATMRELKAIFGRVKAAYGPYEGSYTALMRQFGTEDPGQFKDGATALACYSAHLDRLREMEAMKEAAK